MTVCPGREGRSPTVVLGLVTKRINGQEPKPGRLSIIAMVLS